MEIKATLLANNTITVNVADGTVKDVIRLRDIRQFEELTAGLKTECERIKKLVPPKKPRYVEKPLFG